MGVQKNKTLIEKQKMVSSEMKTVIPLADALVFWIPFNNPVSDVGTLLVIKEFSSLFASGQ